jgi:hypothetical protein
VRIVLYSPPGTGKSRAIAEVGARSRRALVFTRSHLEGLQMAKYVAEFGGDAAVLFGRRSLCPFGAENSLQCLKLRESGVCKAQSRRPLKLVFDVDELYRQGVCPYEALHAAGRRSNVVVLPLAYISKVTNLSVIADLFEDVDFVALDEAHNLLSMVEVHDDELYSRRYCVDAGGRLMCLALPLVGELVRGTRRLVVASASITRRFSHIFTHFLRASYVEISTLPGVENLEVDHIPLAVRYRTRTRRRYVETVGEAVRRVFHEYRRVVVFLPNRELAELYASRLGDLPVSERPLGDIDHVVVTYYGSPVSEGVNLDVKAGVLVGFPIPDVRSDELWLKVDVLNRLGFDGYRYAVLFTAVNHVIQAVGRIVRNLARERKYILLIDDRFLQYRHLLPNYLSQFLK